MLPVAGDIESIVYGLIVGGGAAGKALEGMTLSLANIETAESIGHVKVDITGSGILLGMWNGQSTVHDTYFQVDGGPIYRIYVQGRVAVPLMIPFHTSLRAGHGGTTDYGYSFAVFYALD